VGSSVSQAVSLKSRPPRVALVVTVLNERNSIDRLLASIEVQTRLPDELIVVDGGSRDDTVGRLESWRRRLPLRLLVEAGTSIAQGRNLGIAASHCPLIAVTDAGVRLDPHWLERLLDRVTDDVDVVAGFFVADPRSIFETALGATTLPDLDDVQADRFLPSSRSILFRRDAWQRAGGYPSWLDYCEDLVFDLSLKDRQARFVFAPDARALFQPRPSLLTFMRQYFLYARGDGKADLWRVRHAIRYATYAIALLLLVTWWRRGAGWLLAPLVLGALAYTRTPYRRLARRLEGVSPVDAVRAALLVPVLRLAGDLAKMLGYPVGVAWRLRRGTSASARLPLAAGTR
jgi:glycosyltransferase involved in cell wall biosynthesis